MERNESVRKIIWWYNGRILPKFVEKYEYMQEVEETQRDSNSDTS